ncbi:histidine kinase dimerization/phospho-acceptor domain-containing protein, partial [Escherichia coli]|uniref:histidine kinase dimerization/phospho-acceptor domain-containing protein n=1 Tax=Escherichia coli TaxID=562 RepID=UPI003BA3213B
MTLPAGVYLAAFSSRLHSTRSISTPLTSLVGMTDTLMRRQAALPADIQDTIRAMRDQAQRMHALVANLL